MVEIKPSDLTHNYNKIKRTQQHILVKAYFQKIKEKEREKKKRKKRGRENNNACYLSHTHTIQGFKKKKNLVYVAEKKEGES